MGGERFNDSVKLNDQQRLEVLRSLDRAASVSAAKSRRQHSRFEYFATGIPAAIIHPEGGVGRFLVCARNLSTGGISFLHGGFLHKGTQCRLVLTRRDSHGTVVMGEVTSCRHVSRTLHEVGVRFFHKIEINDFCAPDAPASSISDSERSIRVPDVEGLALVICSDEAQRRKIGRWLGAAGMNVIDTDCLGPALDHLKRMTFDLVLCSTQLTGDASGDGVLRMLRAAGHAKPLIALSPEPPVKGAPRAADATVPLPPEAGPIYAALAQLMPPRGLGRDDSPIYSTLASDPGSLVLIQAYIEEVRRASRLIAEALEESSRDKVLAACQNLRSTAAGYGFPPLLEAAKHAMVAVEARATLDSCAKQVQLLLDICDRLRPGSPAGPAPRGSA